MGGAGIYECSIPDFRSFKQYDLSDNSRQLLDQMVTTCKENNIDIIFYTCPYEGEYNYSNAMKDYASQNGCTYINLFENLDESKIDGNTDLQDAYHLNSSGSSKVADYFGKYIKKNYSEIL